MSVYRTIGPLVAHLYLQSNENNSTVISHNSLSKIKSATALIVNIMDSFTYELNAFTNRIA